MDALTYSYALNFLSDPYIWGGQSPGGWDCSGLVIEILIAGCVLPHGYDNTAQGLYNDLCSDAPICIRPSPGSVAFYGRGLADITHVALCLDGYRIIEAGGGDRHTRSPSEAWDKRAYVRMRPFNYRSDFLTMLMPNYPLSPSQA